MKRFKISQKLIPLAGFILAFTLILCNSSEKANSNQTEEDEYFVATYIYIWPSFHHDERFGDMLWPEGTGEWEIIKKGNPRFEGHYQPKVPLWGYEPDDDPEVMEKWIDAATYHGVNVFISCFHGTNGLKAAISFPI